MGLEIWIAFACASTALLVIPGPTILTVISYSMSHGYKVRLPLVIAVTLGDSTALALSLLGLGALLAKSVFWFQFVKWVGGIYLLYLGVKLLREGFREQNIAFEKEKDSGWKLFSNTYLVTALNPKGIIFFVAFLPQFVSPGNNTTYQLWILATTFVVLAGLNATIYAVFAGRARRLLSSASTQRVCSFSGGTLLTVTGIWALTSVQGK